MTIVDSILLGIVQGIAEFLPISSSGHLILAREVLGLQVSEGLAIDATLQLATALAVLLYFRRDLHALLTSVYGVLRGEVMERTQRILLLALVFGTVPAIIAGLLLEDAMETVFRSAHLVAVVLIAGSILFLIAEYVTRRMAQEKELSIKNGVLIGLFQTLALIPGMSRSGATIAGGMILGLSRETAARFSFLLSLPIILGSGAKKLVDLGGAGTAGNEWLMIGLASSVAFICGIASIHFLLKFLKTHSLMPFVIYRVALALLVFALL
jgi:undecaprenyl-diphosphatase